jgi:hypothetical protein
MSPKTKWITGLLKARASHEDAARQRLVVASASADRLHQQARRRSDHVDLLQVREAPSEVEAAAFVAAASAVQSAAAAHAAAIGDAARADAWVVQRQDEVVRAAVARRTAEKLLERVREEQALVEAAAAQRDLDEAAASGWLRREDGES